jgi:hypothetical protein
MCFTSVTASFLVVEVAILLKAHVFNVQMLKTRQPKQANAFVATENATL